MITRSPSLSTDNLIAAGEPVSKTAWTIALGFAVGMFPLLGLTTIACVLLATTLRLKQSAIQLGNYAALPFQIILLIPFLRLGERITHAERFVFDPPALLKGFPHIPESTARAVVMAQWHMIEGWAVVAPFALLVIALIAKRILQRRQRSAVVQFQRAA